MIRGWRTVGRRADLSSKPVCWSATKTGSPQWDWKRVAGNVTCTGPVPGGRPESAYSKSIGISDRGQYTSQYFPADLPLRRNRGRNRDRSVAGR